MAKLEGVAKTYRHVTDVLGKPSDQEINARLRGRGITTVVSVPCSVTNTMQAEWQALAAEGKIQLIPTNHEHNLVGIASGIYLATGKLSVIHMQNSGFTNAADGIISHAGVYGIPILAAVTWRGHNETDNSEPHQAIGERTDKLTKGVADSVNVFGDRLGRGLLRALDRAIDHARAGRISILRVSPDGFRKTYSLSVKESEGEPEAIWEERHKKIKETKGSLRGVVVARPRISREDALQEIARVHPRAAMFFANGFNSRAGQAVIDRPGNFYLAGYMGGALANGWGYALSNPEIPVVVVDGDQNAMMSCMKDNLMDNYPYNLHWYILDNGYGSSVGVARSLPLSPWYYDLAKVIRTVPDGLPDQFKHPRVSIRGARGEYFKTEEDKQLGSPLRPLTMIFRMWTLQQQQEIAWEKAIHQGELIPRTVANRKSS